MVFILIKKLFKERRSDVSLLALGKFIFLLILNKVIFKLKGQNIIKNSCLILFPPSLGLGDLIILSRIVDIIKESKKYKKISIYHSAPYLQQKESSISLINQKNISEIYNFEEFILPSPSLLNGLISRILGINNCNGYLNNKEYTNLKTLNKYSIRFEDPYYQRLIPFSEFFKYKKDIKPKVWSNKDRENLKLKNSYLKIRTSSNNLENFLVISTYNFYSKFRPSFEKIETEVEKIITGKSIKKIIILGANTKKEINYNFLLKIKLENRFKDLNLLNYTGKLTIDNALDLISQSKYYLGANNGLANVAQMLGINCTLIFKGPEKSRKRNFSKFAKFVS